MPVVTRLTRQQEAVWMAQLLDRGGDSYHIPMAFRLSGEVDPEALDRALRHLALAHPVLCARVVEELPGATAGPRSFDEGPWQTVAPPPGRVLTVHEPVDPDGGELLRELASRPFDPEAPLRFAAHLIRVRNSAESVLLMVYDHLVIDAPSVALLGAGLSEAYGAALGGRPIEPPVPELSYVTYALEQQRELAGAAADRNAEFWRGYLAGLPARAAGRARGVAVGQVAGEFAIELPAGLEAAVHRERASLFSLLLGALSLTAHHLLGREGEALLSYPAVDWNRAAHPEGVGLFTDLLPFRSLEPLPGETLAAYVARAADRLFDCLEHQNAPGADLRAPDEPAVMLSLHDLTGTDLTLDGLAVERIPVYPRSPKTGLLIAVETSPGGTTARLQYDPARCPADRARRIGAAFARVLAQVVEHPAAPALAVELVDQAERERLLDPGPYPGEPVPVTELFLGHSRRTPSATALVTAEHSWNYRQLADASGRIAAGLVDRGVAPGSVVALGLPRSPEFVAAALGVLRAGCSFFPLDTEQPPRRLAYLLADTGSAGLITADGGRPAWAAAGTVVVGASLDGTPETAGPGLAVDGPDRAVGGADGAYVITTSGSTGQPKGVGVPHRALANNLRWKAAEFGLGPEDRVYFKTPAVFDASVWEYLLPLTVGAAVVVAPSWAHRDPAVLAREMIELGVTVVQFVPTLAKAVLAEPAGLDHGRIRLVCFGGEVLDQALAARTAERCGAEVVNLYGPTEAAIDATFHRWSAADPADRDGTENQDGTAGQDGTVPIGRPIDGCRALVLGVGDQLLPDGFVGELHLGGMPLATGYLNRPDLTGRSFRPDPFGAGKEQSELPDQPERPVPRLYRTGDLVRRDGSGRLRYLGRTDGQLKVRGVRLETAELVAAALAHPGVRDAVAALTGDSGDRLTLYYLAHRQVAVEAAELRAALARTLPAGYLPQLFVELLEFPLTASGKVDLRALPAPSSATPADGPLAAPRRPRPGLERRLAALWADVLQIAEEHIPRDLSLFELGGSSLQLIRLHARLRRELQADLPVTDLFKFPTVAAVAAALSAPAPHQGLR
ncbi:non-ribosomal peptide synthetase [Streptomyces sp. TLI_053]|uniref:non-ribosomal peptide synthetase n=1 Tax=Streptomyces sp. TLI_053 TaxID=1855352 RepID=UPI0013520E1B|nr:non-ribosomal peptide synthetase [Streptomyces sp. TLI_053]